MGLETRYDYLIRHKTNASYLGYFRRFLIALGFKLFIFLRNISVLCFVLEYKNHDTLKAFMAPDWLTVNREILLLAECPVKYGYLTLEDFEPISEKPFKPPFFFFSLASGEAASWKCNRFKLRGTFIFEV